MKKLSFIIVLFLILFVYGCEDAGCPDLRCTIELKSDASNRVSFDTNFCEDYKGEVEERTRIDGAFGSGIRLDTDLTGENSEYKCLCKIL